MALRSNRILKLLRPGNYILFFLWRIKIAQVFLYSRASKRQLKKSGGRGLFFDCGSNTGQGFEFFQKFYSREFYDYVLFEPNPYCFKILSGKYLSKQYPGVELINAAIGIADGLVNFYGLGEERGGIYSVGGTTLVDHNSKLFATPNDVSLNVQSINFVNYIQRTLRKNSYSAIILKLDIEGGEYVVLEALIKNNLLAKFDTVYVEFHSQYMQQRESHSYKDREREVLRYSKSIKTRVVKWI